MNRRHFMQSAAFLPLLPGLAVNASMAHEQTKTIAAGTAVTGRRIILLELAGANDGLNTVVPWSNNYYHELRPTIGLKGNAVIAVNDNYGFHHRLKALMPVWDASELAVVHAMGYPKPNRSHFKSIALWEAGGDGYSNGKRGWPTHDIEHAYASSEIDAHGIVLGGSMGIFSNGQGNWLSMTAARQFANRQSGTLPDAAAQKPLTQNPVMQLLVERARTLKTSLDSIAAKVSNSRHSARIGGNSRLSQQLTHTVNLINAGVDAPVFKVSLGGFDTHEGQLGRHQRLLKNIAISLHDLRTELVKTDQWKNTIVMTYSEFGRRVTENGSRGTDHGTAAAHLILGGSVNGGFYGTEPDLANLSDGDLRYTMDYRSVYNRLLSDWLKLPADSFSEYRDHRLDSLTS